MDAAFIQHLRQYGSQVAAMAQRARDYIDTPWGDYWQNELFAVLDKPLAKTVTGHAIARAMERHENAREQR